MGRTALRLCAGVLLLVAAACGAKTPEEHLLQAREYRDRSEFDASVIELKNALQQDPNFGEARLMLGELQLELGDVQSALKELERALDLGVAEARVLPPLLEAKVDAGRTQEVLGAFADLELSPRLLAVRGQALLAGGDVAAASADFDAALAGDPATPRAYLGLAQIAASKPMPDLDGAIDTLRAGTVAAPSSRRLWLALGEFELNRADTAGAKVAFDAASKLPGSDSLAELGLARVRMLEGDLPEARKLVEDVIRRTPQHPLAQYLLGVIALQSGDLQGAETALQTTLSVVPDYPPALLALAHVKKAQGQPLQAEAQLRRYIVLDPENLAAHKALAGLLLENGDASGAVAVLDPIQSRLTDGRDLALLGTAKLRSGDLDGATQVLTAAAEAMPESGEVNTQLALSLAAAGDNAAALRQLDAIVPTAESDSQTDVLRVLLNMRSGEVDMALAAAQKLVASGERLPLAYNLLGAVQLARKDVAAARTAFERALEEDAGFGAAALNLARIHQTAGDGAAAQRVLEQSLEADGSDVGVRLALAQLAMSAGDAAKATSLLEEARAMNANALEPRIVLGRLALRRGDLKLAEAVSLEAEALAPSQPATLLLRAQVSAVRGRADAVNAYLDGLEAHLAGNPPDAGVLWIPVGELQRQMGRIDRARSSFEAALTGPSEIPARIALVQLEVAAKRAAPARAQLAALKAKGLPAPALNEMEGDIAAADGQMDVAERRYADASAAGLASAAGKLALLKVRKGEPQAGIKSLERWLEAHPDSVDVAMVLASLRITIGDPAGAKRDYEQLLTRQGNNPVLLNNLAWLYFEAGDNRAEAMARKAAEIAPDSADINDTLGWILVQSNEPSKVAEALSLLGSAARARPNNPTVQYHLAVAQEKSGRRREARQTLDRALEVPEFPERAQAVSLAEKLR